MLGLFLQTISNSVIAEYVSVLPSKSYDHLFAYNSKNSRIPLKGKKCLNSYI